MGGTECLTISLATVTSLVTAPSYQKGRKDGKGKSGHTVTTVVYLLTSCLQLNMVVEARCLGLLSSLIQSVWEVTWRI